MSDVRGPHVAHLEREAEAGASPPSLSASPGARVPGAPAGGIFTSGSPLKRESYRGRPLEVCEVVHKTPYPLPPWGCFCTAAHRAKK